MGRKCFVCASLLCNVTDGHGTKIVKVNETLPPFTAAQKRKKFTAVYRRRKTGKKNFAKIFCKKFAKSLSMSRERSGTTKKNDKSQNFSKSRKNSKSPSFSRGRSGRKKKKEREAEKNLSPKKILSPEKIQSPGKNWSSEQLTAAKKSPRMFWYWRAQSWGFVNKRLRVYERRKKT